MPPDTPSGLTVNGAAHVLDAGPEPPVLAWQPQPEQSAAHVVVTDGAGNLVWDSGAVPSTRPELRYGGPPLTSRMRYRFTQTRSVNRPAFVLHEHRRPRHHFDLRLEEAGVLRSWAVPRGLPDHPARNRLAIAVADHGMDHLDYTDEHKSIADTGWWEEHERDERHIVFTLHGRTGSRRYALIFTGADWLLHLNKEQPS